MEIIAFLQNLAAQELLQKIPPGTLEEIKKEDSKPFFQSFVIAHTGESKSWFAGVGSRILRWYQDVVSKIKDKIKVGAPVFHLHGKDNSHEGRKAIGKVVAALQNSQGQIEAIIHRFKDSMHLKLDAASFEMNLPFLPEDNHEMQPHELGEIRAIALANSAEIKPAFAGALKAWALQCLNKEKTMPTLKEIQDAIREDKIDPLEIFDPESILSLDFVKERIQERKGNENQRYHIRRLEELVETARAETKKAKEESEKIIAELKTKNATHEGMAAFTAEISSRDKLTESQKKYIEKQREKLTFDPAKPFDAQSKEWIDKTLKDFDALKELFNPESPKEKEEENIDYSEESSNEDYPD